MGPRKRTNCKIMAKNSGNGVRVPNSLEKGLDPLVVEKQGDDEDEPDWKRRFEIEEEQERKENELFLPYFFRQELCSSLTFNAWISRVFSGHERFKEEVQNHP